MTENVVVLGAGYAGAGAIKTLHRNSGHCTAYLDRRCRLSPGPTRIPSRDTRSGRQIGHHLSVDEIADPSTRFIQDEVVGLDPEEQVVELAENDDVDYDYVLVGLGSQTAYYGIPGLDEHSLTLKSLDDALEIHEAVKEASTNATRGEPAQVVVGGAGLRYPDRRRDRRVPRCTPCTDRDPPRRGARRDLPRKRPRDSAGASRPPRKPRFGSTRTIRSPRRRTRSSTSTRATLEHDVLIWTGGITGRDAIDDVDLENEHNRLTTEANFQTSDERVFATGDSAIIDQGDQPAPPTAQAAWQAADVAGENIARAIENRPLKTWEYDDKGTVVSVGEKAAAHEVKPAFGVSPRRYVRRLPGEEPEEDDRGPLDCRHHLLERSPTVLVVPVGSPSERSSPVTADCAREGHSHE